MRGYDQANVDDERGTSAASAGARVPRRSLPHDRGVSMVAVLALYAVTGLAGCTTTTSMTTRPAAESAGPTTEGRS
jgi:hypothetical protein